MSVQVKRPDGASILYTSNITAHRAIAASDFSMSCAPASSTIAVTSSGLVTCTLSAINIAATASASATIATPAAPAGWTLTVTSADYWHRDPIISIEGDVLACAELFSIGGRLNGAVTSTLVLANPNTVQPPQADRAGLQLRRFAVIRDNARSAHHVGDARLDPQLFVPVLSLNPSSLSYTIDAVGCSGWNVQISASQFVAGTGATVPASNLTLTGSTLPSGAGIPTGASGPLNTSIAVLSASPPMASAALHRR
ncbi:MAG: hypothetical protein R2845_08800 [Thermomicrobiales bacterium]